MSILRAFFLHSPVRSDSARSRGTVGASAVSAHRSGRLYFFFFAGACKILSNNSGKKSGASSSHLKILRLADGQRRGAGAFSFLPAWKSPDNPCLCYYISVKFAGRLTCGRSGRSRHYSPRQTGRGPARNGFLVHNRACLSVIVVERTVSSPAQTSDLRSRKSEYPRSHIPCCKGCLRVESP
jgi:hypothetical protein